MDIETQFIQMVTKNPPKAIVELPDPGFIPYFNPSKDDRTDYVISRIRFMRDKFLKSLGVDAFQPVGHESTKPFYTYGMVTTITGEPNNTQYYICNPEDGSDVIVPLNLSRLGGFSLFCGQIAAVKGRNPSGSEIIVEGLYQHPVLSTNPRRRSPIHMSVAAGPFTTATLDSLIQQAPQVLLLMGPLADPSSPTLSTLSLLVTRLKAVADSNPHLHILLVPSLDDHSFINLYPQPGTPTGHERVFCLPNPSMFYVNNHLVLVNNYDVLSELGNSEYSEGEYASGHLMAGLGKQERLAHHMLFQRVYLPMMPARENVIYCDSMNVDISPDLYITGSVAGPLNYRIDRFTVASVSPGSCYKMKSFADGVEYSVEELCLSDRNRSADESLLEG